MWSEINNPGQTVNVKDSWLTSRYLWNINRKIKNNENMQKWNGSSLIRSFILTRKEGKRGLIQMNLAKCLFVKNAHIIGTMYIYVCGDRHTRVHIMSRISSIWSERLSTTEIINMSEHRWESIQFWFTGIRTKWSITLLDGCWFDISIVDISVLFICTYSYHRNTLNGCKNL